MVALSHGETLPCRGAAGSRRSRRYGDDGGSKFIHVAKPKVHERIPQAARVGRRRLDEHVEVLGQARLTVTGDRV
jgi:hypothetical protein